jgi:hypothetical protein
MKGTVNIREVMGLLLRIDEAGCPRRFNQTANIISDYRGKWWGMIERLEENHISQGVLNYISRGKLYF